jgi:hypothetical protein
MNQIEKLIKDFFTLLAGGTIYTRTDGKLIACKTATDAVEGVVTFATNIGELEIVNTDSSNAGTFTVNGITITVPASGTWMGRVGGTAAKTVTVATATTYLLRLYA